jgi:class 3 adenylate cyclase
MKVENPDVMQNATLLFADIAGFTAYSAAHKAEEVVKMLR